MPNILALTLPIGTLFAVLMTAARMAADSELVAMQASGVPLHRVARPLVAAACLVCAFDMFLMLVVMPRSNAQLSETTRRIALSAASAAVEQRVFAEDFPGQLLYVDRIDRGTGRWHGVLLFDSTDPMQESLVTADSGDLVVDPRDGTAWLNLQDTTTHLLRPDRAGLVPQERQQRAEDPAQAAAIGPRRAQEAGRTRDRHGGAARARPGRKDAEDRGDP